MLRRFPFRGWKPNSPVAVATKAPANPAIKTAIQTTAKTPMLIILRVDDKFLSLWERTLDLLEGRQQKEVDAITGRMKDSNDQLAEASKP